MIIHIYIQYLCPVSLCDYAHLYSLFIRSIFPRLFRFTFSNYTQYLPVIIHIHIQYLCPTSFYRYPHLYLVFIPSNFQPLSPYLYQHLSVIIHIYVWYLCQYLSISIHIYIQYLYPESLWDNSHFYSLFIPNIFP